MSITSVVLHVADLERSVDFYRRHLRAEVTAHDTEHALLDLVTATLDLRLLVGGRASTWKDEDATRGFRHIGLKVGDLDGIVRSLDLDEVVFRSRPLDIPDAGVRNAFFFDPDGTVIELVENHLRYHVVLDADGVAEERRLPTPKRPRFDHIGHTVEDVDAAIERYNAVGFATIGQLQWPSMRLDFLRSADTVIELFTLPRPSNGNRPVVDAYGFVAIAMSQLPDDLAVVGELADGRTVQTDPDDLAIVSPSPRVPIE